MVRINKLIFLSGCVIALGVCAAMPGLAVASLAASDDASDTVYNDSWSTSDNGGTGFSTWSTIGNSAGSGSGGGFIGTGTSIDVGGDAFGIFGNGGGTGQAIRSFTGDLAVGQPFSIDMDNGGIDNGGTVGFGLRNSAGANLFEFFFVGGTSFYRVNKSGGVTDTTTGFTFDGLSLVFTLTDSDSFSFTIDLLSTGVGVDETVTGDLLSETDQGIEVLRLFNANGGSDAFFNSLAISAVPEPSAFLFGGLVFSILGLNSLRRKQHS